MVKYLVYTCCEDVVWRNGDLEDVTWRNGLLDTCKKDNSLKVLLKYTPRVYSTLLYRLNLTSSSLTPVGLTNFTFVRQIRNKVGAPKSAEKDSLGKFPHDCTLSLTNHTSTGRK